MPDAYEFSTAAGKTFTNRYTEQLAKVTQLPPAPPVHPRWEVNIIDESLSSEWKYLLADGYEPFAASEGFLYFKRKVTP